MVILRILFVCLLIISISYYYSYVIPEWIMNHLENSSFLLLKLKKEKRKKKDCTKHR